MFGRFGVIAFDFLCGINSSRDYKLISIAIASLLQKGRRELKSIAKTILGSMKSRAVMEMEELLGHDVFWAIADPFLVGNRYDSQGNLKPRSQWGKVS